MIPVIDLFAGPGGLGEGFSSLLDQNGSRVFRIGISIEKDPVAHKTLRLRSFFRQFEARKVPSEYYDFLRSSDPDQERRWLVLKEKYPKEASAAEYEARNAELGKSDPDEIDAWIRAALKGADDWVLIGGPPCQAYSIAGRSRNSGKPGYVPEKDKRQYLYKEYLRILATHRPAVFIMENVKGLLSATLQNESVFEQILNDLRQPSVAVKNICRNKVERYRIFSLTTVGDADSVKLEDFVVRAEQYGIPQARHRIILLGIRENFGKVSPGTLKPKNPVTVRDVLHGLPPLRSGLSKQTDDVNHWQPNITNEPWKAWFRDSMRGDAKLVAKPLRVALTQIQKRNLNRGSEFISVQPTILWGHKWYLDKRVQGVCNHSARSHISRDLHRYFYAAVFAQALARSPNLEDFPGDLLPFHKNVKAALSTGHFSDRFRVQLADRPATTITSHISKDGHYYIHYDPSQCRSLTVREAARLQTFPDNYFFCGPRTSQYIQVGNAVPPLLAQKIAEIVWDILKKTNTR